MSGLYGNKFITGSTVEQITYEQLIDIYYDSYYSIESLFDQIDNNITNINEDTLALSGPVQKRSAKDIFSDIIKRIKELFDSFVKWISKMIKTFTEWVTKLYNNANVKDRLMTKLGRDLSWSHIKNAIEKGWKGLPKGRGLFLVKEMNPATLEASGLIRKATSSDKEYNKYIDKIRNSKDLNEAEEEYKNFDKSLRKEWFNLVPDDINMIIRYNNFKVDMKEFNKSFNNLTEEDLLYDYIIFSAGESEDGKHYKVSEEGFNSTKKMALSGQKLTKDYKNSLKASTDIIKKELVDPVVNENKNIKSNDALSDEDKINIIYNKARIKVGQYIIRLGMRAVKDETTIMKYLNNRAISTYLYLISVGMKYNKTTKEA